MINIALYGNNNKWIDVTNIINRLIQEKKWFLTNYNESFGDPLLGVYKKLIIKYNKKKYVFNENTPINLCELDTTIIDVDYIQIKQYFDLYIHNNKKLEDIIEKNIKKYNFEANFEKYFRCGDKFMETRALLENYNMIFILNSIIKKNIIGYCYETKKEYICDKITLHNYHPNFFYGIINYHFNIAENEFIIGLNWEYYTPTFIYYVRKNTYYNIDYKYDRYQCIKKINCILSPMKVIDNNKKFKYCIGIINNAGHYVWNELTGLMFLFENNLLDDIDFIIGTNDFLNVRKILKNKGHNVTEIDSLFNLNEPVINCCKIFINNDLSDMLKKFLNIKNKETKDKINICFDIRTNSRICINEQLMIEYIISNLQNNKNIKFYISGWLKKNNENDHNIILQNNIFKDIQSKFNFKINNLIGSNFEDVIKDLESFDIIISNDGSGISFISKCFTENLNITYTNNSSIYPFSSQKFFFEKFKKRNNIHYLKNICDINKSDFKILNFEEILCIINDYLVNNKNNN